MPGPPSSRKIGSAGWSDLAWIRVTGSAISRDCRVGPVLGNDERPAVGLVATVLGGVGTALEDQVSGVGSLRHGHGAGVGGEAEVGEAEDGEPDDREGDDSRPGEGLLFGSCSGHVERFLSRVRPPGRLARGSVRSSV